MPKPFMQAVVLRTSATAVGTRANLAIRKDIAVVKYSLCSCLGSHGDASPTVLDNIVLLDAQYASYDKLMPWQTVMATFQPGLEKVSSVSSAGFIVERGLILASAYVAVDSTMITVQRQGGSKKFPASIVTVATDLDLALLNVTNSEFWQVNDAKVHIDPAAHLMGLGTAVIVPGFPITGDLSLSLLESSVVGVKANTPGTSERYGSFPRAVLSLHPQISNDVIVGPVFGKTSSTFEGFLGRSGMVIPLQTVSIFLKSYKKDKTWHGAGMLGLIIRSMEAGGLRKYWKLPDDGIGVQIRSVCKDSPLHGKVQKGDVLRAVDGQLITATGASIYPRSTDHKVMLPFQVLLGEKKPGDPTRLTIFRTSPRSNNASASDNGKIFNVTVKLRMLPALAPRAVDEAKMQQPTYFILGGLVWTVFTEGLLSAALASEFLIPIATQVHALNRWREDPDEEVIMLLERLDHPCNKFYFNTGQVLKYFNGKEVKNMTQFVQMAGNELQGGAELLQFAFLPGDDEDSKGGPHDPDIVLDVSLCTGADAKILQMHQVAAPVSQNLRKEYVAAKLKGFASGKQDSNHSSESLPVKVESAVSYNATVTSRTFASSSNPVTNKDIPWFNVVQVQLVAADQDYISPWMTMQSMESRCSAIIVNKEKRLILTNSHCVASAKSLDVLREDAPNPVPARVVELAHDVDLAWVTTDDANFWASTKIQPMVSMSTGVPAVATGVRVVGYPTGGSSITITEGIVSRIDGAVYPNGLREGDRNTPGNLLIVQVDAAINPGNSGGPVFDNEGHLLGLAFANLQGAQSIGYVIPNEYCTNFINAVRDGQGRWQAQPEVGALFRPVSNPGMRKFLQLEPDETGQQVRSVSKFSPLWKAGVRKGDVLLKIDDIKVTGIGKVLRDINGHKIALPFDTLVTGKPIGEKIQMDFVRPHGKDGKPEHLHLDAEFRPIPPLVARFDDSPMLVTGREHFAAKPTYFMFYGLIFGVISNPVLQQAGERNMVVPWSVEKKALHNWREDENQELVVLLQALNHPCNMNYDWSMLRILAFFNGQPIKNLRQFKNMALAAEAGGKEEFMRFTFTTLADADAGGTAEDPDVVLHRDMCADVDSALMRAYNMGSRYSEDLRRAANSTNGASANFSSGASANSSSSASADFPSPFDQDALNEVGVQMKKEAQDEMEGSLVQVNASLLSMEQIRKTSQSQAADMMYSVEEGVMQSKRKAEMDFPEVPVQFYNGIQQDPAVSSRSPMRGRVPFIAASKLPSRFSLGVHESPIDADLTQIEHAKSRYPV